MFGINYSEVTTTEAAREIARVLSARGFSGQAIVVAILQELGGLTVAQAREILEERHRVAFGRPFDFSWEYITLYEEECDCYQKHGRCLHVNGGNYHDIENLVLVWYQDQLIGFGIEETTTRESFPGDEFDTLVADPEGIYLLYSWAEPVAEWAAQSIGMTPITTFRKEEFSIVWGAGRKANLQRLLQEVRRKFDVLGWA